MKINVNRAACSGHGRCAALAPEVYELDDNGYNSRDGEFEVPAGLEAAARLGADNCPERCITVVE
ncbi:MAG: ferredoxin [Acidimicrobiia bacterium]